MHDPEHDPSYANFSKELIEARRAMRKDLLKINDPTLTDRYYRALMLSEHEARRLALVSVVAPEAPPPMKFVPSEGPPAGLAPPPFNNRA